MPSGASAACSAFASASRALPSLLSTFQIRSGAEIAFGDRVMRLLAVLRADSRARRTGPTSSAPNQTTRMVRSGRPASMIRLAAAAAIATPARRRSRRCRGPSCRDGRRPGSAAALGSRPGHFGDDIARLAVADVARRSSQAHRHRLAALQDALQLLGVGNATARRPGSASRRPRSAARRCADCGDSRCRSSGRRSPIAPLRLAMVGPWRRGRAELAVARAVLGCAAWRGRRTRSCRAPLHRARPSSASTLSKPTISPVMPCGRRRCAVAERGDDQLLREGSEDLRAFRRRASRPACRTARPGRWRSPSPSACATAQSRARASASVPARRWPTSVVSPSVMSQA